MVGHELTRRNAGSTPIDDYVLVIDRLKTSNLRRLAHAFYRKKAKEYYPRQNQSRYGKAIVQTFAKIGGASPTTGEYYIYFTKYYPNWLLGATILFSVFLAMEPLKVDYTLQ